MVPRNVFYTQAPLVTLVYSAGSVVKPAGDGRSGHSIGLHSSPRPWTLHPTGWPCVSSPPLSVFLLLHVSGAILSQGQAVVQNPGVTGPGWDMTPFPLHPKAAVESCHFKVNSQRNQFSLAWKVTFHCRHLLWGKYISIWVSISFHKY